MNKKILKYFGLTLIVIGLGALLVDTAMAYQIPDSLKPNNIPFDIDYNEDSAGGGQLITILQLVAGALLYVTAPLAVLSIALASFNMVMFSGASEKVEEAKRHLTWAILGLVIIIFSYALVRFIIGFVPMVFNETPQETPTTEQPA